MFVFYISSFESIRVDMSKCKTSKLYPQDGVCQMQDVDMSKCKTAKLYGLKTAKLYGLGVGDGARQ